MRTDPRYTRVRDMLNEPEVPRHRDGGIALCHHCQRTVYFDNGFLRHLTKQVQREAKAAAFRRAQAAFAARKATAANAVGTPEGVNP